MDSLPPILFSYPAIAVVAILFIIVFIIMLVKKTLKAIVMLIMLAVLTAMVVVKVGIVDKKAIDTYRDTAKKKVEEKVRDKME